MEPAKRHTTSLAGDGWARLLVENIADYAIYMLSPEGIVTSWNAGARRFKGYEAPEILGQHFSRFYTEEDRRSGLPQRALQTAATEGRFESEGWRVRKDGSRFWASVVIDPIRGPTGEFVGFAKITRDLTERQEAQGALEKTREALAQSQKMEAIGQLTGGMAHDFNNLLTAILGSLDLVLKRAPDDPKVIALLNNAVQAAERGASLTQRMLAFARRQELSPEPVDLPRLVKEITSLLRQTLGPMIAIEAHFSPDLSAVRVDANQLESALLNLMVNARDAMSSTGNIVIRARNKSVTDEFSDALAPGQYVCLTVADTGEGMDEATLARAVEPFFTTKGPGKGTGLGLSMVHGLAVQSQGKLVLKSTSGVGTTVELWLPAATPTGVTSDHRAGTARAFGEGSRPLTVLAVDDDNLVLLNTTAMLEDRNHVALRARSGQEALDILRKRTVDVVVTDQAMPRMTGLQLAEAIAIEWPELPVVIATGYAELPRGTSLPKLAKPFRQNDLLRAIIDATQARRGTVSS